MVRDRRVTEGVQSRKVGINRGETRARRVITGGKDRMTSKSSLSRGEIQNTTLVQVECRNGGACGEMVITTEFFFNAREIFSLEIEREWRNNKELFREGIDKLGGDAREEKETKSRGFEIVWKK